MRPEERIEEYLISRCRELDYLHYKFTAPSTIGVPDRIVIGNGHTLFVELKAPGKKPRRSQEVIISEINDHGGCACYTDSFEGIDEILRLIETTPTNQHLDIPQKYRSNNKPRFILTID